MSRAYPKAKEIPCEECQVETVLVWDGCKHNRRCGWCNLQNEACKLCGAEYRRGSVLDPFCSGKCYSQHCENEQRERITKWITERVPLLYRNTVIEKLPRADITKLITDSFKWHGNRGLFLKGASGTGKTRTAYLVLQHSVSEGANVATTTGGAFQHEVVERTRPGGEGNLHKWLAPLKSCDVLLFDEVEKMAFSKRVETEFFNLFNTRVENGLTTIFASNATLTQLCGRMSSDTGPRRNQAHEEFCNPYQLRRMTAQSLTSIRAQVVVNRGDAPLLRTLFKFTEGRSGLDAPKGFHAIPKN